MSKFEIGQETEAVQDGGMAINLEKQVGNWLSWKKIPNQELRHHIVSKLLLIIDHPSQIHQIN